MGHTRGGGIGNRAGSYDHTRKEVEAEIRQRIATGDGYGDITEDELDRLVGKTTFHYQPDVTIDRDTLVERLTWLATADRGAQADWLVDNDWHRGIAEVAKGALNAITENDHLFDLRWRADMRAIKRWRAAAPGRELTWPDHSDLVVWLLEQREDQIKAMVDRFLQWKLPEDFAPDGGISFKPPPTYSGNAFWPVGTNLFTAAQATAMIRHMVEGMLHRPAYPDDMESKTLLEAHYKSALDALAKASAKLEEQERMLHLMSRSGWANWRPIAEAPIPAPEGLPDLWTFSCLLQNARGIVGEGIARYVSDGRVRGNKRVKQLRWYFGDGSRDTRVCHDPRYFMPMPAKKED